MGTVDVYLEWEIPSLYFLYKNIVVYRSTNEINPNSLPEPIKTLDKNTTSYIDPVVPLNKIPNYAVGCLLYNGEVVLSDSIDVEYIVKITNEEAVNAGEDIEFEIFGFGNKNGKNVDFGLSALEPNAISPDDLQSSDLVFTFVGNKATGTVRIKDNPTSSGGNTPFLFSRGNRNVRTRNQVELNIRPFSHRFTNAGATGRFGPSLTQCRNAYSGEDWVNDENQFTVENGIQIWTVPVTGTYRITAAGASGAEGSGSSRAGKGAALSGEFLLRAGLKIEILVGQEGFQNTNGNSGGGGGASFVCEYGAAEFEDILIISGGGGGGGSDSGNHGVDGISPEDAVNVYGLTLGEGTPDSAGGKNYVGNAGLPGHGGSDGNRNNAGGGGGGFLTSGHRINGSPGTGYLQGGHGARGGGGDLGGFGGGAATQPSLGNSNCPAGAGGGFSGGQGGGWNNSTRLGGGGGGSFNAGENQDNQSGVNSGHGYVEITRI